MASKDLYRLTPASVMAATRDAEDGGGLWLRFQRKRPEAAPTFVFRFTAPDGRRRELSCGRAGRSSIEAANESLSAARVEFNLARALLAAGRDPVDERSKDDSERSRQRAEAKAARDAKAKARASAITLRRFAREYHEEHVEPVRTSKHAAQWIASIEGPPVDKRTDRQRESRRLLDALLDRPITEIEADEVLRALVPLCRAVPETGQRVYQRLVELFDYAVLPAKLISSNPATPIRRQLNKSFKRRSGKFKALDWRDLPAFMERLRAAPGTAARCLEFTILTASRTSEALGCRWSEIDLDRREWRVPAERMKRKDEGDHVVFLSDRAIEIIKAQQGQSDIYAFASIYDAKRSQSNMAMLKVLDRLGVRGETTVHGLARACFSTWAAETHAAAADVVEAALAHKEQDRVRAAYMRGQFLEQRRQLAQQWADFLDGKVPATAAIIPLRAA